MTQQKDTGHYWVWLVCFVLFGSPMAGLISLMLFSFPLENGAADGTSWSGGAGNASGSQSGIVAVLVLTACWLLGFVPTLITGMMTVVSRLRLDKNGALGIGMLAFLSYGLYFSALSGGRTVLGPFGKSEAFFCTVSGMVGSLFFFFFLPGTRNRQETEETASDRAD